MNVYFFIFVICVSLISRGNGKILTPVIQNDDDLFDLILEDGPRVNSTVAKAVTLFYCMVDLEEADLLVYGTKAWQFPEQDINLTLTYPSDIYVEDDDYVITGFKVQLFVDSINTKGYINSGGLFKEYVSLSFVSPKVNMLSYQFWLYGTPKSNPNYLAYSLYDFC